jgi:hypothetical protein
MSSQDDNQMMQAQQNEEHQLWLIDQKEQQEYQQYLDALTNDFYGSSVTLMTELN